MNNNQQDVISIDGAETADMPAADQAHNVDMNLNDGGLRVVHMQANAEVRRRLRRGPVNDAWLARFLGLSSASSRDAVPVHQELEHKSNHVFIVVGGTRMDMASHEILSLEVATLFNAAQQAPALQSFALLEGPEVPLSPGCAAIGSRIFLVGGLRNGALCRDYYTMDAAAQDEHEFAHSGFSNRATASATMSVIHGRLYKLNGFEYVLEKQGYCSYELYDSATNTWGSLPSLSFDYREIERGGFGPPYDPISMFAFGSWLYVSHLVTEIYITCWDTASRSWEECDGGAEIELPFPKCAALTVHLHPDRAGDGLFMAVHTDGFLYLHRVSDWCVIRTERCFRFLDPFPQHENSVDCYFAKLGQGRYVFVANSTHEGFTVIKSFTCEVIAPYSIIRLQRINSWRYGREEFVGFFTGGDKEFKLLGCHAW